MTVLPLPAAKVGAVDQDGATVLLWGVPLHRLGSESNAARAADALQTLVDLGLLTPRGRLRAGLQASVAELTARSAKPENADAPTHR